MKLRRFSRRWAARGTVAAVSLVTLGAGLQAAATAAVQHGAAARPADPYSPAYQHPYRHGVVPNRSTAWKMRNWQLQHPGSRAIAFPRGGVAAAASGPQLTYGGGNPSTNVGVTTGTPKVYLVFWGSQWGTPGTDSKGDTTFVNDPSGMAPYLQQFYRGLGNYGERWSGVMTQYCDGVTQGATSCPGGSAFVGHPTNGVLAGVWADESAAEPLAATAHQIGVEAVAAASHFGNTTAAANRNAQYVIVSSTGLNPDGWQTAGFCAWHDWNGDDLLDGGGAVTSGVGDVAFTNLPYVTDAGSGCGQSFVNPGSKGTLDGVSIVAGHEYAETITDQEPGTSTAFPYGWYWDDTADGLLLENADICAWLPPGADGGSSDMALVNGTYAVQTTWANDAGVETPSGCEAAHPVNGAGNTNTVTVNLQASRNTPVGASVKIPVSVTDSDSGQTSFHFSATGLPPGTFLSRTTGSITGAPSMAGVYHVTVAAKDGTGSTGASTFSWTVNLIRNPGFESGVLSPWSATSGVLQKASSSLPAHSGKWLARLDGRGTTHTDTLSQKVKIPLDFQASYSFYLRINSNDPTSKAYDTLKVQVLNTKGTVLATLHTYSNLNTRGTYFKHSFSLTNWLGRTVVIKFTGKETLTNHNTAFLVDDNLLTVH